MSKKNKINILKTYNNSSGVVLLIVLLISSTLLVIFSFFINISIYYTTKIRLQSIGSFASYAVRMKFLDLMEKKAREKPDFDTSLFRNTPYVFLVVDDLLYIQEQQSIVDNQVNEFLNNNLSNFNIQTEVIKNIEYIWPTSTSSIIDCSGVNKNLEWNVELSKKNKTIIGQFLNLNESMLINVKNRGKIRICN